jgi:PAS domain S-box-containing protein
MSTPAVETKIQTQLRLDAEKRLKEGSAPPARLWATSAQALTLLHKLASDPGTAGDALKLLHELQVHQVELDMQYEQMEQNLRELSKDPDHYAQLYDFAPIAYFTVDLEGKVIEANVAGARLFGVEQNELDARPIDSFLAPKSRPVLHGLLKRLASGSARETCDVQFENGKGISRRLRVVTSASPGGRTFFFAFIDTSPPPPKKPDRES